MKTVVTDKDLAEIREEDVDVLKVMAHQFDYKL